MLLACVAAVGTLGGAPAGAADRGFLPSHRVTGPGELATSVRHALEGARRRLSDEDCAPILDDFRDARQQTLRSNLAALQLEPPQYLDYLVFYDGEASGHCRSSGVLAMTVPGSRVIAVCGARFVREHRRDARHSELVLIHEALHTLGLGENPPRSSQITSRVYARCGR